MDAKSWKAVALVTLASAVPLVLFAIKSHQENMEWRGLKNQCEVLQDETRQMLVDFEFAHIIEHNEEPEETPGNTTDEKETE